MRVKREAGGMDVFYFYNSGKRNYLYGTDTRFMIYGSLRLPSLTRAILRCGANAD